MGDGTGIEWTDATWNPTVGCSRVSPGCDHCYAERFAPRLQGSGVDGYEGVVTGSPVRWTGRVNVAETRLGEPLRWTAPRRIFVDSMSDLFHPEVSVHTIARVFSVMARCPQHTFQVLTKRPQRMATLLASLEFQMNYDGTFPIGEAAKLPWPLPNVWLGVSIESDTYSWRADYLRAAPAAVRFVSAEPLLGPLESLDLHRVDWVIVGGESGPRSRPMHPAWARDLRDACTLVEHVACGGSEIGPTGDTSSSCSCQDRGPAFLFKQWGEWAPWDEATMRGVVDPRSTDAVPSPEPMVKLGKRAAGRTLDGRTWDEYPA